MIRPPRLRPGDRVAVVAPAGPVPRDRYAVGAQILGERYTLVESPGLFDRAGYLAGDDRARLAELEQALADPTVRAIFCARGGYGVMRLLEALSPGLLAAAPKPIVGFSDITALHAWAVHAGFSSVHGPVVTQLGELPPEDRSALLTLLEDPAPPPPLTGLGVLRPGRAEGILLGGNLELVSRLVGTPFALPLDGALLFLEDVGERPYRVDRALTQLLLSGALDRVAGVVVGEFTRCLEPDGSPPTVEEVLAERLGQLGVPVLSGAPVGHGARNRALPHGVRARLDSERGSLEVLEGAVA